VQEDEEDGRVGGKRKGHHTTDGWALHDRHFFQQGALFAYKILLGSDRFVWTCHCLPACCGSPACPVAGKAQCATLHKKSNLLVVGFASGIFGLYELPGCANIHTLSISSSKISTVSVPFSLRA
jgi:hypothetical protein